MKQIGGKLLLVSLLIPFLGAIPFGSAAAASSERTPASSCSTRFLLRYPQRCTQDESSASRIDLALQDLSPVKPLPIKSIDPAQSHFPFNYLRVTGDGTDFYPSLESACRRGGVSDLTSPGFVYLSYPDGGSYQDEETIVFHSQYGYFRGDNVP